MSPSLRERGLALLQPTAAATGVGRLSAIPRPRFRRVVVEGSSGRSSARHALCRAMFLIALKVHAILHIRWGSFMKYSRVFAVVLRVDTPTEVRVGTACTWMPLTRATVPPMVDWAYRYVFVVGNIKHHSSPNAKFADIPIKRDLAPVPVLEWPFFV